MEKNRYNYYSQGNLATQPTIQPDRKRKVVRRKKRVKTPNIDILKSRLKLMAFLIYIFSLGLIYVLGYSGISRQQRILDQKAKELDLIVTNNLLLQEEMEEINDLTYIYTVATEQLHMIKPENDQIRYITLTELDYSEIFEEPASDRTKKRIHFRFNF